MFRSYFAFDHSFKEVFFPVENQSNGGAEAGGADLKSEVEKLKDKNEELSEKNAELSKEVKSLKKTNASLDKQLKEMLEDGQLTL